MTVNRRANSNKHRTADHRLPNQPEAESSNGKRRSSLCNKISEKIKKKMDSGPIRLFRGHHILAISLAVSSLIALVYLTSSVDAYSFNSFYQVKRYILDTYGSKVSKLTPEFPTRAQLNVAKNNHHIRKVGHVPGRFLSQKKGINAQRLNTKLFKRSYEVDTEFLDRKIWNNYTIDTFKKNFLDPILIERVSGTPGAAKVIDFISNALPDFYDINYDISIQPTALNDKRQFKNIIASSNKFAERQFIVACHFDSKYWPNANEVFIGAIDSAVPCAMMIQMAWNLGEHVKKSGNLGLQFYFFDGEEAFIQWTRTDSVYGSRNMVNSYKNFEKTLTNKRLGNDVNQKIRKIDRINCFMLLDLIGNPNPRFSHDRKFSEANDLFKRLTEIEQIPFLVEKYRNKNPNRAYFNDRNIGGYQLGIDDDHMPWYRAGVRNILHMIPTPFPHTWHTIDDNEANLDYDTIYNLQLIFDTFAIEYLRILA